jgi:hypothetical protein
VLSSAFGFSWNARIISKNKNILMLGINIEKAHYSWTMAFGATRRRRRGPCLFYPIDASNGSLNSSSLFNWLFSFLLLLLAIHVIFVLFGSGEGKK